MTVDSADLCTTTPKCGAAALFVADTGAFAVERLEIACTFMTRLAGLQFRRMLEPGDGLLLVPCASVHTCFMRFAIDLVMLDRRGRVNRVARAVKPWRGAVAPRGTHAVLELPAGTVAVAEGDQLAILLPPDIPGWLKKRVSFFPSHTRSDQSAPRQKGTS